MLNDLQHSQYERLKRNIAQGLLRTYEMFMSRQEYDRVRRLDFELEATGPVNYRIIFPS